jgi:hypothetical protein
MRYLTLTGLAPYLPCVGDFPDWTRDHESCVPPLVFKGAVANCTSRSVLDAPDDIIMCSDQFQLIESPRVFWIVLTKPLQTFEKGCSWNIL